MKAQTTKPVNPSRDRLLLDVKRLVLMARKCIADGRWEKAEELSAQIELITDRLREMESDFSLIFLDAANVHAKLAIYRGEIALAEIHLSFVSDVCLNRPSGEFTTQFADCLECYSRVAMARKDWDMFGFVLEKCAEIRREVLGPHHVVHAPSAVREWEKLLDIMSRSIA